MKYDVAVDMMATIHYDIEADDADEAYKKVFDLHNNLETIDHRCVYSEEYYVFNEYGEEEVEK